MENSLGIQLADDYLVSAVDAMIVIQESEDGLFTICTIHYCQKDNEYKINISTETTNITAL